MTTPLVVSSGQFLTRENSRGRAGAHATLTFPKKRNRLRRMSTLAYCPRRNSLIVLSLAFVSLPLFSQSFYGSIVGTVTDSTGATIGNAEVLLVNSGTSERRYAHEK